MPANVVKTAEDERLWNKAKAQAEKQGRAGDYAYIMGIFKRMAGRKSEEPAECVTPGEKKRSEGFGVGEARGGGKGPMGKPVGLKKAFTIPAGFKTQRIPGQVPAKSLERAAKLDKMPKGSRAAQLLNHTDPMFSPNAVVKGLGFDMTKEGDWTKFLEEAFQTSPNELVLRKAIMEKALLEKQEPALRRAILERSLSYWRGARKSMVEVLTPDEILEKATPFGGKTPKGYIKKKGRGGKPVYVKEGEKSGKKAQGKPKNSEQAKVKNAAKAEMLLGTSYASYEYAAQAAADVSSVVAKHAREILNQVAYSKDISGHPVFDGQGLEKALGEKAQEYYKEAVDALRAGDAGAVVDWTDMSEFIRQVVKPGLSAVFNAHTKYSGFGPLSYVNRLRKMDKIPWLSKMHQYAAKPREEYHELRVSAKKSMNPKERFVSFYLNRAKERGLLGKAEARGGKYYKRVPKKDGNGHHYFYKPEDYDKREDRHVSGEEASKAYISGKVSKCVAAAGEKGCGPDAFQALVKKHGHKSVAQVLKDSVNGGKLSFKKGKFYAVESKQ